MVKRDIHLPNNRATKDCWLLCCENARVETLNSLQIYYRLCANGVDRWSFDRKHTELFQGGVSRIRVVVEKEKVRVGRFLLSLPAEKCWVIAAKGSIHLMFWKALYGATATDEIIGVIYHPETEKESHYSWAALENPFDKYAFHVDRMHCVIHMTGKVKSPMTTYLIDSR